MQLALCTPLARRPRMSFDLENLRREYAAHEPIPLSGYVASMAIFTAGLGAALVWMTRQRRALPPTLQDVALLGTATHKLSRILSKDFVTAPVRAPFTRRASSEGAGEVQDEARGGGLRRAVGHLLTCPYCLGPWIATGLGTSMAKWPHQAGFVTRVLTAVTVSDFLHLAYARLNESRRVVVGQRKQLESGHGELPLGRV
jgi:hypothetical protein